MRRFILPFLAVVTVAAFAAFFFLTPETGEEQPLIPTLSFGALSYGEHGLLGQAANVPVKVFTETQAQGGVALLAHEHNLLACPEDYNTPIVHTSAPSQGATRMWAYKYSGNERANLAANRTGRQLFDGEFYFSARELAMLDQTKRELYDAANTFTTITGDSDYYFMSETDFCFRCGQGIQGISTCTGASSSAASSVQFSQTSLSASGSSSLSSFLSSSSSLSSSLSSHDSSAMTGSSLSSLVLPVLPSSSSVESSSSSSLMSSSSSEL